MTPPRVSAVVVHYRAEQYLAGCLDALAWVGESLSLEIIVVDNASLRDVVAWRDAYPQVAWLVQQSNRGFAAGVNAGARAAHGQYLLIMNPDASPERGSVERLVERLDEEPRVGAVTPRLRDATGAPQPAGGREPTLLRLLSEKLRRGSRSRAGLSVARSLGPVELEWASATALLCRRSAWDDVGGMDEGFFLYYEDCDLSLRMRRRGWHIELVPSATVVHVGGASFASDPALQRRAYCAGQDRYFRKHRPVVEQLGLAVLRPAYDRLGVRSWLYGQDR